MCAGWLPGCSPCCHSRCCAAGRWPSHVQQLTPPITSLSDFERFSHEHELDGLRHLSLSVLEHMCGWVGGDVCVWRPTLRRRLQDGCFFPCAQVL